jgi:hypothetical protein
LTYGGFPIDLANGGYPIELINGGFPIEFINGGFPIRLTDGVFPIELASFPQVWLWHPHRPARNVSLERIAARSVRSCCWCPRSEGWPGTHCCSVCGECRRLVRLRFTISRGEAWLSMQFVGLATEKFQHPFRIVPFLFFLAIVAGTCDRACELNPSDVSCSLPVDDDMLTC